MPLHILLFKKKIH